MPGKRTRLLVCLAAFLALNAVAVPLILTNARLVPATIHVRQCYPLRNNRPTCYITWTGNGRAGHGELKNVTAGSMLHGWANSYYVTTNPLVARAFPVPFIAGFNLVLAVLLAVGWLMLREVRQVLAVRRARVRLPR
jgi:hypothetical protein